MPWAVQVTLKPTLFVNPTFTVRVDGMGRAESDVLLDRLYTKSYSTPECETADPRPPHTHTCAFASPLLRRTVPGYSCRFQ